ncbi:hypothetical protein BDC45DRAFT_538627 [Circinella umbellata]|nr:hypothetical protein BDC45DRAFT_538627 [Circinella umbellata]
MSLKLIKLIMQVKAHVHPLWIYKAHKRTITESIAIRTTLVPRPTCHHRSQEREIYEGPTLQGGLILKTPVGDTITSQGVSEPCGYSHFQCYFLLVLCLTMRLLRIMEESQNDDD